MNSEPIILCQLCGTTKTSVNYIWDVWNQQKHRINNKDLTLMGYSVAAQRTNFYIRELNIMFDGGLSSNFAPSHLFITHAHTDHIANCPWHFNPGDTNTVQFYVPASVGLRMQNFLEASHPYSGSNLLIGQSSMITNVYNITEVSSNSILNITIKGKKYLVEIIECDHTVPCVGFGFSEIKTKLKEEYLELKGNEIKELREKGVEITQNIIMPMFVYLGDTGKKILSDPKIEKYQTIMIECTFLEDSEIERADETKHMHWISLKPYVIAHPQNTFILYHFSSRYRREFIRDFFKNENIPNVIIWNSN